MTDCKEDSVAVPRSVIASLYRFLHQAWEGAGRETSEGSHGKDLLDWRETMSAYHRKPAVPAIASDDVAAHLIPVDWLHSDKFSMTRSDIWSYRVAEILSGPGAGKWVVEFHGKRITHGNPANREDAVALAEEHYRRNALAAFSI